ncbi:MAG: PD40 domain-containing protein [Acidobacteriia bacterium]|nr:PD40 domain-containing protein [Terriglobia bacterium]
MNAIEYGKGSLHPSEVASHVARSTGARIFQITNHPSINHLSYFLQSSFTPDSRRLIFTSYRTGNAQLFEAGFPDGDIRQLTAGAPIHPYSPTLSPDGQRVFFVRGGSIWALDRASLEETRIVEFAGAQLGECTLGDGGRWITAAIKQGFLQGIVTGRSDGSGWRIIPFTRTVIHPQFHPLDPEWLEFAGDPAPRMYRVRRDGTGLECLYANDGAEWITHETFLGNTGDLIFVHWPKCLYRMDWTSRAISPITNHSVWHISPNRDGKRVLCDTNHPDEGIFQIDVATGTRRRICLSESGNGGTQWTKDSPADWKVDAKSTLSWLEVPTDSIYGPQWTHPHPCFSPDEKFVTFTSNGTGFAQVYVAENTVTR